MPGKSLWTRSVIQGKWKLITYQDPLPSERPNAGGHKRKVQGQNQELFDLLADPHESTDLSNDHPDVVKKLQAKMLPTPMSCHVSDASPLVKHTARTPQIPTTP